eukprot:5136804-Pleurochrysis_carterae.AAC.2
MWRRAATFAISASPSPALCTLEPCSLWIAASAARSCLFSRRTWRSGRAQRRGLAGARRDQHEDVAHETIELIIGFKTRFRRRKKRSKQRFTGEEGMDNKCSGSNSEHFTAELVIRQQNCQRDDEQERLWRKLRSKLCLCGNDKVLALRWQKLNQDASEGERRARRAAVNGCARTSQEVEATGGTCAGRVGEWARARSFRNGHE